MRRGRQNRFGVFNFHYLPPLLGLVGKARECERMRDRTAQGRTGGVKCVTGRGRGRGTCESLKDAEKERRESRSRRHRDERETEMQHD